MDAVQADPFLPPRPVVGPGWLSIFAYAFVECSLYGAFGYFGNITIQQFFHVGVPWPWLAFGALAVSFTLAYFDVRLSTRVLGVALVLEIVVLTIMAVAVFAHGGGPTGISAAPINPVNAFKGLAPGVGIFFAVWSWVGFETIPNYAEESRNPRRIGAQALFISVIGGGLFFAVVSWAVITGWGLHAAVHQAATNGGNFYYGVTTKFAAKWVTDVMEWLILTSSFACALSFHNTNSRYLYVIGREKIFHPSLGRTHSRWKSPHVANAATTVIVACLLGLFLIIWYSSKSAQAFANFQNAPYYELFGWFAIVATFSVLVNMTLSSLATIAHFRRPSSRTSGTCGPRRSFLPCQWSPWVRSSGCCGPTWTRSAARSSGWTSSRGSASAGWSSASRWRWCCARGTRRSTRSSGEW